MDFPPSAQTASFLPADRLATGREPAGQDSRGDDEHRYRDLLDALDAGFCVIEPLFDERGRAIDYVFRETNPSFERATGLRDVVGLRMRALAPAHEQAWFDIYGRVARTGEPVRFEQEARALGRWYNVYAYRVGGPSERRVGILFEDITARKRAEQRRSFLGDLAENLTTLREEEAVIGAATRALSAFLETDRCFFVERERDQAWRLAGRDHHPGAFPPADELPAALLDELASRPPAPPTVADAGELAALPLPAGERALIAHLRIESVLAAAPRREARPALLLVVAHRHARAWSAEAIKLVEEVAARVWPLVERARSERALRAAHEELERRVAERTEKLQEAVSELEAYSYSISHDLRAPLRAMQTYATILTDECADRLGPDGAAHLRRITLAAERMDRLIRDVLAFSRTSRGHLDLERVELLPFIRQVIETYPNLENADARFELIEPLGAVCANEAALSQCVSNLLDNAIKFVAPGVRPHVRVWAELRGARTRLFIGDNARGIPPELAEKIFGMFYQVEPSLGGTGIGLAIVRKAVERMGGAAGVLPAPGGGSIFWLELDHLASAFASPAPPASAA